MIHVSPDLRRKDEIYKSNAASALYKRGGNRIVSNSPAADELCVFSRWIGVKTENGGLISDLGIRVK